MDLPTRSSIGLVLDHVECLCVSFLSLSLLAFSVVVLFLLVSLLFLLFASSSALHTTVPSTSADGHTPYFSWRCHEMHPQKHLKEGRIILAHSFVHPGKDTLAVEVGGSYPVSTFRNLEEMNTGTHFAIQARTSVHGMAPPTWMVSLNPMQKLLTGMPRALSPDSYSFKVNSPYWPSQHPSSPWLLHVGKGILLALQNQGMYQDKFGKNMANTLYTSTWKTGVMWDTLHFRAS